MNTYKIDRLKADNYDCWKIHMRAILIKGDLWSYVNGSKPYPTGEADADLILQQKWLNMDEKAQADITLGICSSELGIVSDCTTSQEMWNKLKETFQSKGSIRKATLLKGLVIARLIEEGNIRDHLNTFFDTVNKLKEIDVIICDDLLSILLLYSLPDSFETFRCAMESRDELPKIDILRVKILEEEQSRKSKNPTNDQTVMIANYKKFKKEPNNYKTKTTFKCFKCDKPGHLARNCKSKSNSNFEKYKQKSLYLTETAFSTMDNNRQDYWCLDSGCSSHMSSNKIQMTDFKNIKKELSLANKNTTEICGIGNMAIEIKHNKSLNNINFKNVMYVPDLRTNLLSVSKITDNGCEILFKKNKAIILENRKPILEAERNGDLYFIKNCKNTSYLINKNDNLYNWHLKLGHLNENDLKRLPKMVHGLNFDTKIKLPKCETCISQKQTQEPFLKSEPNRTSDVLEIVHTDVCGPMRNCSHSGAKYFVTFTDDFSRNSEIFFIKHKSEVFEMFKKYKNEVETFTGKKIKQLQSDNGTEYLNKNFNDFLNKCGIKRRLSTPYTPQQNGIAERKNRTLLEMSRCLLKDANMPPIFWAEAINTSNYVRNRCPTKILNNKVPYEIWTGKTPTLFHLKQFGLKAYTLNKKNSLSKFESRSEACVLVGYSNESKAYRLWSQKERKIIISRDVKFMDVMFYQKDSQTLNDEKSEENAEVKIYIPKSQNEFEIIENVTSQNTQNAPIMEENLEIINEPSTNISTRRGRGRPKILRNGLPGRPKKIYQEIPYIENNLNNNIENEEFEENDEESEENDENFEECEFANFVTTNEPKTLKQAINGNERNLWIEAIEKEIMAQVYNNTWDIVNLPKDRKPIGNRFVFTTKQDNKKKARLVAKGYSQRPGEDFNETYSPVARSTSIRLLAAMAANLDLKIHQMDVTTAYLNGDLEEDIYMQLPENINEILNNIIKRKTKIESKIKNKIIITNSKKWLEGLNTYKEPICKLRKSLYGLKQSGLQWFKKLTNKLYEYGLKSLNQDPCFFYKIEKDDILLMTVYVDDLLIASNNDILIKSIKDFLNKNFEMVDIGPVKTCLGIKFSQNINQHTISLSQEEYIEKLLNRFKMEDCNTINTPLEINCKLNKPKICDENMMKKYPYQNLIGALMFLAVTTRPDISYAVNFLSQFNTNYNCEHWKAAKRILKYLKGTKYYILSYKKSNKKLYGVVDADWGANVNDRRSYSGYAFILAGAAISWEARKQRTVALSSTEAEYLALSEASKEAIYLKYILKEIGQEIETVQLFNDNQSAHKLAQSVAYHPRTKHIDVRHHFIRERIKNGDIAVQYISTQDMPADVLTKGLCKLKHKKCILDLGITDITLRGNVGNTK